jgi:outer membrane protein assembly factor BamB
VAKQAVDWRIQALIGHDPRFLLFVFLFLFGSKAQGADWPGWRGPAGTGVSKEDHLPTQWSATEKVRWRITLSGKGVSTPIVVGDRIFLTASEGRKSERLHVYCFHRVDGRTLWHTRLLGTAESEGEFGPGGMAVPTPAADTRHVYVLFGTGELASFDFDGQPIWIRSLAQEYGAFRNRWGMGASPLLLDGLLVILVDHWGASYLLGIDAATGRNRWKTARDAAVNWSSPVAACGGKQIVVSGTNKVKGYDANTGRELWTVMEMQQECISSPIAEGNKVFAASGPGGLALALRLNGGQGDLPETNVVWRSRRGTPNIPSPLCLDDYYYQVSDQGIATCLSVPTGAELWRERLRGSYHASLVAGDGKVYFTNLEGVTSVVRAGPRFHLLARCSLGEAIVASPAISKGQLFFRGEKHLYCIGEPKP